MRVFFYRWCLILKRCALPALLAVVLAGCVTEGSNNTGSDSAQSDEDPMQELTPEQRQMVQDYIDLSRSSIVTMGKANLDRNKPSTLSWSGGVRMLGNPPPHVNPDTVTTTIYSMCNDYIHRKGYYVVPYAGDFQIEALLVFDDGTDRMLMLREAGIDPGLGSDQGGKQKGALVIKLKQGRAVRWRGAVQVYIAEDLSEQERRHRVSKAVAQLLSTWP